MSKQKKTTEQQKIVKQWEDATQALADAFMDKYYQDEEYPEDKPEWHWAADVIGDMLFISDDFWNVGNIVIALKKDIPSDDLFNWYYESIDAGIDGKQYPNLTNYMMGAR